MSPFLPSILFAVFCSVLAQRTRFCYHCTMKFNWKRTFLCSLAFGWISLFWGAYDAILQTMDYGVFGLNEVWHGVIIAMDNILGLILLPLFGRLSDNAHSKFGNRKPFVVIGTVISMVGFAGVCVFASLGKDYFVPYTICLMITLAAMAAYRSPALSIVPDLNPDKFRNMANAVSNVVSVILTVLAQLYYYVFMMFDGYYAIGAAIIVTTAVMLAWFCFSVKENKFKLDAAMENEEAERREQFEEEQRKQNSALVSSEEITAEEEASTTATAALEMESVEQDTFLLLPNIDFALSPGFFKSQPDETDTKKKRKKFRGGLGFNRMCILAVVFCFYMAYNALASNFTTYAQYILGFKQNEAIIPLILAQVAAMAAFPLASILASKIGRKITMLIGFAIMTAAFGASFPFTTPSPMLYVLFIILGISFGIVMINIYPFFLETTKSDRIGSDTGIFATSMTLAMAVTPILSGALISVADPWFGGLENAGFRMLFPYSMVFLVFAFIITAVIKSSHIPGKKDTVAQ